MSSDYHFITEWRVAATIDEVKQILSEAESLTRWWPAVYLGVTVVEEGQPGGVGRVVDFYTKGWLPYTLRWTMRVSEPLSDTGYALDATGDFVGTGRWHFHPDGPEVIVTYDWRIRATKPLLRRLSWLLKPVFSANHRWAMRTGEESLKLELRRRRAKTDEEGLRVLPPPPTTFRRLISPSQG
jgi:hypothetical protein